LSYLNPYIHLEALTILAVIFLISMKFRFIDRGGVVTSFIVGYIIYVFGGRVYFLALLTFYLVSVAFTKIRVRRVKEVENKEDGVRGWRNVLANGLTATCNSSCIWIISRTENTLCSIPWSIIICIRRYPSNRDRLTLP
jgi:uncharacterized membrane protein